MMYELPTSLTICGVEYAIRSDYRAALDVLSVFAAVDLDNGQKVLAALNIFYPDFLQMPDEHIPDAVKQMTWFLDCGDDGDNRKRPKLMDWEQDFQYIVAPINRVVGQEVRAMPYFHWWSFVSAYYEIGDCLFANIVRIRSLKAKGKTLDKSDREFYRENRRLVDLKKPTTEEENDTINAWLGKKNARRKIASGEGGYLSAMNVISFPDQKSGVKRISISFQSLGTSYPTMPVIFLPAAIAPSN